jgi:short subunit dehydrogenase-like uncharacterized protein
MVPTPSQSGPIAVYGATGYTGKLVCAELARAGVEFVVSGRNRTKLDALRSELGLDAPAVPATVDDPGSLRSLLADCATVIDCAGPFVRLGEPVLAAAVETKTHYLDTTGEQPYIRMVFERYGPAADRAGIAVVPAMGFDYAPGDMLAALTAEGMAELDRLSLHYSWLGFSPSQGTARTTLEIMAGNDVEWREGELVPATGGADRGTYSFPDPIGPRRMLRYPAGEQITVPRHIRTQRVLTEMNASAFASERFAGVTVAMMRPAGMALRTPLRRVAGAVISRLPEGPSPEQRDRMQWMIVCEAVGGDDHRKGLISGRDVYGLTAVAVVNGAIATASDGFERRGALAPSQAFEPRAFLAALDAFDVRWDVLVDEPLAPVEV